MVESMDRMSDFSSIGESSSSSSSSSTDGGLSETEHFRELGLLAEEGENVNGATQLHDGAPHPRSPSIRTEAESIYDDHTSMHHRPRPTSAASTSHGEEGRRNGEKSEEEEEDDDDDDDDDEDEQDVKRKGKQAIALEGDTSTVPRLEVLLAQYVPSPQIPGLSHIRHRKQTDELAKVILTNDQRLSSLKGIVPRWHIKFLKHFPEYVEALVTLQAPHEAHAEHDKIFRGKIYSSATHFFFYGKYFNRAVRITVPWHDVLHIAKRTGTVHNRGLKVITIGSRFFFRSVFRRDAFLNEAQKVWQTALQSPRVEIQVGTAIGRPPALDKVEQPASVQTMHTQSHHDLGPTILSPSLFQTESRPRTSQDSLTKTIAEEEEKEETEMGPPPPALTALQIPPETDEKEGRSSSSSLGKMRPLRGSLRKVIKDATRSIRQNVASPSRASSDTAPAATVPDVPDESTTLFSRASSSHSLHLHPDMVLPPTCPCTQHLPYLLYDEVVPFKLGQVVQAIFKVKEGASGLPDSVHPEYQPGYTSVFYKAGMHHVIEVSLKSIVAGGVDLTERFCLTSIRCPTTKSGSRDVITRVFVSGGAQRWDSSGQDVQRLLFNESEHLRTYLQQVQQRLPGSSSSKRVKPAGATSLPRLDIHHKEKDEAADDDTGTLHSPSSLISPARSSSSAKSNSILRRGHARKTSTLFRSSGSNGSGPRKKTVHYAHSRTASYAGHDFASIVTRRHRIRQMYDEAVQRLTERATSGSDAIKEQAKTVMRIRRTFPQTFFATVFVLMVSLNLYITYRLVQENREMNQLADRLYDSHYFERAAGVLTHTDPAPYRQILQEKVGGALQSLQEISASVNLLQQAVHDVPFF